MQSVRPDHLVSLLLLTAPLAAFACSDDPAVPPQAQAGGSAGAVARGGASGNSGAAPSAGAAGGSPKGGQGGGGVGGKASAAGGTGGAGKTSDGGSAGAGGGGVLAGQGGASGAGADGGAAGAGNGGTAVGGAGAGTGGGGVNGGAGGGASTRKKGTIAFSQDYKSLLGADLYSVGGTAEFTLPAPPDPTMTCETKTEGPCVVRTCVSTGGGGAGGGGGASAQPFLDAGDIVVSGLNKALTFSFNNSKTGYGPVGSGSYLWNGNETVAFQAAGGPGVGAFTAQVKAPKKMTVSEPFTYTSGGPIQTSDPYVIDLDVPYQIAWNATANAEVEVVISSTSSDEARTARVTCQFDPADNPSFVPPSLLGYLVKNGTASLAISAVTETAAALVDTDVAVRLAWPSISGSATLKGVGNDPPTDPAVCEAAGSAAAEKCPGTPISAALCATSKELCRVCIAAAAPGDCAAVASCDGPCAVVTPGSKGAKAGTGSTLPCSQACKAEHCAQTLGSAGAVDSLAVVGNILFVAAGGSLGQLSAAGGKVSSLAASGLGQSFGSVQAYDGFLYFLTTKSLARLNLSTSIAKPVVGDTFFPPRFFRADAGGLAFLADHRFYVASLDGSQGTGGAIAPGDSSSAMLAFAANATSSYVIARQAKQLVTLFRASRSAPTNTDPAETVAAGIAVGSASFGTYDLALVDDAAFFLERGATSLTRIDLITAAVTKVALPAAKYRSLATFEKVLYLSSDSGVLSLDGVSLAITGTYNVGVAAAMTFDDERVYFSTPNKSDTSLRSFCR